MMTINANTKIGSLLKHNPAALDAIVSISPKFEKLRNPILRKLIAARTSIATASKMVGCSADDFFNKLEPLGFNIDKKIVTAEIYNSIKTAPAFLTDINIDKISELDVRPVFAAGKDPLDIIIQRVKNLEPGQVLKIINSFEPTPLMQLLGKQGFESYAEVISDDLVNTYFYKRDHRTPDTGSILEVKRNDTDHSKGWDEILTLFKGNLETIDVSELEMPLPMHTILEALANLPAGRALLVYHKRIPVFLLPELDELHFSYRIKEVNNAKVQLLIYRD